MAEDFRPPARTHATIVGQMPSATGKVGYDTASGRRMVALCSATLPWMNVFDEYRPWSDQDARARVQIILRQLQEQLRAHCVLILLGRRVARAFRLPSDAEWLEWYRTAEHRHPMIAFPHQSAVNRWWNDEANVAEARKLARAVARGRLPLLK